MVIDPHPAILEASERKFVRQNMVLAVDQGAKEIGWARATPDAMHPERNTRPECNTYKPPSLRDPSGRARIGVVLLEIERSFLVKQFELGVRRVVMESTYVNTGTAGNIATGTKLASIRDFIQYVCEKHAIPYEEVSSQTWRLHFLGVADSRGLPEGLSLKDAAEQVCGRIGWSVVDHHQAEALGIINYVMCRDFPGFAPHWDPRILGLGR
jgi:hypothetical protein